jgi:hypothetical protein
VLERGDTSQSLFTTKKKIHTPVLKNKHFAPPEHGTKKLESAILIISKSIAHLLAKNVR